MKEVVVILSLMCAGHLATHGGHQLANSFGTEVRNLPDLAPDPRFVGFEGDKPLSRCDIERYNRIYGIPIQRQAGRSASDGGMFNALCLANDFGPTTPTHRR